MKNLGTKGNVTTWKFEESDIPKIPMPISSDILKDQPERSKREDAIERVKLNSLEVINKLKAIEEKIKDELAQL
jgi:hypothetical protein